MNVQVQYQDRRWQVDIPKSVVEAAEYDKVVKLVRQAAPPTLFLPRNLHLATLNDALWTPRNLAALAQPNRNYIWLKEVGKTIPLSAQHRFGRQP